jgi:hypothetical protein
LFYAACYFVLACIIHTYLSFHKVVPPCAFCFSNSQIAGIDWDDAANQCTRRGMVLASVRTAGEQSALVSAVAEAVIAEIEHAAVDGALGYSAGAEFDHVWLGAQRTDAKPYWHWRDGRNVWENEYTNWAPGFEYSDSEVQLLIFQRRPVHT